MTNARPTLPRGELVAALVLYVLPVLGATVALYLIGLRVLAAGLLGVEVLTSAAVAWARRRPARPVGVPRPVDGSRVVLAVVAIGVVGAVVLLAFA